MPGLCGWLETDPTRAGTDVLAAMRAGLPGGRAGQAGQASCHPGAGAAVAVASSRPGMVARGEDDRIAAVDGHPYGASPGVQTRLDELGPAAAALELYAAEGEEMLARLRGPFALAILDPRRGRALIAIDRMGVHTMVHAEAGQALVFASTADAVRAHPAVTTTVSPQAVYRYAVNYVSPAPYTIYDECRKLLPAHALSWAEGRAAIRRYWRIPYGEEAFDRPIPELRDHLFELMDRAVRRAGAQAPGRVGAFLSGGLDSSAVSGFAQRAERGALPVFTIGFADSNYDETVFAESAVSHFGLEHHTYRLTPKDAADLVPELAEAFDEPFGNSSVIPATYCARLAKSAGVDLLLAGDGGDEIFGGNKRYVEQKILSLYHGIPAPLRAGLGAVLLRLPEPLAVSALGKGQRYVRKAQVPMPERMLVSEVYRPEALATIFTPDALAVLRPEEPFEIWRQHYEAAGTDDLIYAMLHLDTRVTLADNDLRKVGRAAEMADIQVAFPMLDEELVEFAARIPSSLLVKGLDLRHFFKKAMAGFLPNDVIHKKKQGFGMPFAEWTRSDPTLWRMVTDAFATLKGRHVFREDFLDRVLDAHRESAASPYSGIVWDLLMLELWWRKRDG